MKRKLQIESELETLPLDSAENYTDRSNNQIPEVLNVAELIALRVPAPEMLIEEFLPASGASLMFGAPKSGKTILAIQVALAVATGTSLFDSYAILKQGAALIVEQDDPAGAGSIKDILVRSRISLDGVPFFAAPRVPFTFGPQLLDWLEGQIVSRGLRLVVLDSYTSLRSSRRSASTS
jgi:hypothetical protein